MKALFKKYSFGFYPVAVACLLLVAALISGIVTNSVVGYNVSHFGWVVVLSVVGLIAVFGSLYLVTKKGNQFLTYLGLLAAIVCEGICFTIIVTARAELVGTLWITSLDSVNPLAVAAMNSGAASFFIYLISMIFLVVGGFMPIAKEN